MKVATSLEEALLTTLLWWSGSLRTLILLRVASSEEHLFRWSINPNTQDTLTLLSEPMDMLSHIIK